MAERNRESEGEENIESRDGKGHLGQASFGAILPSDKMALTRVLPLNDGPLPKIVIVDLDKTLWPFYCHEQTMGPYERHEKASDAVRCRSRSGTGKVVRLFPDVLEVLRCLKHQGSILLAVASRSPIETAARGIMGALGMIDLFCFLEIHRGSKAEHASNIMAATGVPYRDMMFFDDSKSNIKTVQKLGVCCIKVSQDTGLTFEAVRSGLEKYRTLCSTRSKMREWFQPPIQQIGENTSGASYAEGIVSEEARHMKQDNTP